MAPVSTVTLSSIDTITAHITVGLTILSFIAVIVYARRCSRRGKRLQLELYLCQNELDSCQSKITLLESRKERRVGLNAGLEWRNKRLKHLIGELRDSNESLAERLKGGRKRQRELVREKEEADDRLRKMEDSLHAWGSSAESKAVVDVQERLRDAREECRQSNMIIETLKGDREHLVKTMESYEAEIWELKDRVAEYRHCLLSGQPYSGLKDDSKLHSSRTSPKPGAWFWSAPAPDLLHKL